MTTIVYHNNVIYSDTLTSTSQLHPRGDKRNLHCQHCGEEQEYATRRESNKLSLLRNMRKFRGEQILAIAAAGKRQENQLQVGYVQDVDDYEDFVKKLLRFTEQHDIQIPSTLMIVTVKHVYVIVLRLSTSSSLYVDVYGRDEMVVIGNGGETAKTLIKAYGETPEYAIAVVADNIYGTGGSIDRLDLTAPKLKIERVEMPAMRVKEVAPTTGRRRQVKGAGSSAKPA